MAPTADSRTPADREADPEHPAHDTTPRLQLLEVSKTFGTAKVLDAVSLTVASGEVHGLVGQNGSGKSTLIKVLSGVHRPDRGARLLLDGNEAPLPVTPRFMIEHGLAFVHQNLGLDPGSTVTDNVRLGRFHRHPISRKIDWRRETEAVASTLERIGQAHIHPLATVGRLNHADRTSVAIARALQSVSPGGGCIVFDETTQSLPRDVLRSFYSQVRALAASGTSVVIVSHRIPEVLSLCDRVTVLDRGRVSAGGRTVTSLDEAALARLITGREAAPNELKDRAEKDWSLEPIALSARGLRSGQLLDTDFEVRAGEVLGITGDPDSGADEIAAVIAGAKKGSSGRITVDGAEVSIDSASPAALIRSGLAYVPAQRVEEGVAVALPAGDNLSLPRYLQKGSRWWLGRRWMGEEFAESSARLGITPVAQHLPVAAYSGGNQQKILIAKWLKNAPRAIVLHEPVQAVDVGAREDILRALRDVAADRAAVIIVSIEAEDLARICDRVLVLDGGRVRTELRSEQLTPQSILDAVYTKPTQE